MDRGACWAAVHRVTGVGHDCSDWACVHVIICYIQFYPFVLKCFCVCIKILRCFQKFFNFSGMYLLIRVWHNLSFWVNIYQLLLHARGFPDGSDGKEFAHKAGDQVQSLDREDPLEKEMATHSSTLASKIPWMEKPGRLQSMGSQKVGHD